MSPRIFTRLSACLLGLALLYGGDVFAQQKIQIFRGGEESGASQRNVIPGAVTSSRRDAPQSGTAQPVTAPAESATEPSEEKLPYSPAAMQRIQGNGSRLATRSFDSFRRGLMPLHDHIDQLQLVADSEFRLLGRDGAGSAEVAARHLERIRRVERALRDFDEPNAEGWRADLFLARALVAQAEFDLARVQGNESAAEFAAQRARLLAERHLIERRYDSSIGLASLPMLLHAEMLTPDGAARGRQLLVQAVRTTRRWNQIGAGIGRADKVAEAEFELARFDFFVAFDSEEQNVEASFQAAAQASQRMLTSRMEYYKNGTASLYEIARSWQNMREIVEYAASTKSGVSQAAIDRSRANLNRVVEMSRAKSDSRGRIAADLAYVSLINEIATAE